MTEDSSASLQNLEFEDPLRHSLMLKNEKNKDLYNRALYF